MKRSPLLVIFGCVILCGGTKMQSKTDVSKMWVGHTNSARQLAKELGRSDRVSGYCLELDLAAMTGKLQFVEGDEILPVSIKAWNGRQGEIHLGSAKRYVRIVDVDSPIKPYQLIEAEGKGGEWGPEASSSAYGGFKECVSAQRAEVKASSGVDVGP